LDERYLRNLPAISPADQQLLAQKRVLVAGCGGLGGYIIEFLARLGIEEITVVDGDVFHASDLNRQILCTADSLGRCKVSAAAERIRDINPHIRVCAVNAFLTADNASVLLKGQDLVFDGLDNVASRLLLEDACTQENIPLIHGAICGWSAQAAVIPPGSGLLRRLYQSPAPEEKTVLPFTPALCAAMQVSLGVTLLCGREREISQSLFFFDLEDMQWQSLPFEALLP